MKKDYLISIPIILLLILLILLSTEKIYLIDNVYNYIVIHNKMATNFFKFITNFGSYLYIVIISILLLIFYPKKKDLKNLYIITIISTILTNILKIIIKRPRPELVHFVIENTYSFPSGHASASLIFYGYLIYIIWISDFRQKIKIVNTIGLIILILLVGYSRVYLNVHYISDVLAGFIISFLLLYFYIKKEKENKN